MRVSKATLVRSLADLQAEVEKRIHEGFWARVKRYHLDRELRQRLALAQGARTLINREKVGEGY